jgi:glycine cleavage system regulatory protein
MNRQLLLSFQGPHHPEILSRLGALLDSWPVMLLDLHGLEQDQIFSGLWQLEWVSEQDPQLMEKSLCSLMQEFDMQFRLSQSEAQPKKEQAATATRFTAVASATSRGFCPATRIAVSTAQAADRV